MSKKKVIKKHIYKRKLILLVKSIVKSLQSFNSGKSSGKSGCEDIMNKQI